MDVAAVLSCLNVVVRAIPPSVLPDISPSRGEITVWTAPFPRQSVPPNQAATDVCDWRLCLLRISPLEGEMPGRAEGG